MDKEEGLREKLLSANETTPTKPGDSENISQPHWYWGNWVFLGATAACCFTATNLTIGYLSPLGFSAVFYYNSGALLFCITYFVVQSRQTQKADRVLIWKDGKLDFELITCFLGGAVFGSSIFFAINTTFYFCGRADLNIGIAETIWGFTPFLTAILEYFIYKT